MMRATTEFWGQILSTEPATRARSVTSTASPWWKTPDPTPAPALAGFPSAWPPEWMPWSALTPAPAASPSSVNPIELWQQMWMPTSPFAGLGFGSTMTPGWPLPGTGVSWPWQPAAQPRDAGPWHPIATAYRSANGHATAAVLRTMADVVEPKPRIATFADFWPNPFISTRH